MTKLYGTYEGIMYYYLISTWLVMPVHLTIMRHRRTFRQNKRQVAIIAHALHEHPVTFFKACPSHELNLAT